MNISTALSSIGGALRSAATAVTPIFQSAFAAAPAFAPLIAQAIAGKQRQAQAYGTTPYGGTDMMVGTGFMPGGYTLPSPSLMPAGYTGITGMYDRFASGVGSMLQSGSTELGANVGCIVPRQTPGRLMLPRTVNVTNPMTGNIETYVRAPRVKYRVSVSRVGRRGCSGGR